MSQGQIWFATLAGRSFGLLDVNDPKVTEKLEMRLGFKTWSIIYLGAEIRTFGS